MVLGYYNIGFGRVISMYVYQGANGFKSLDVQQELSSWETINCDNQTTWK